ncbi:hypothetical protein RF11_00425 [Thelohanellus kitauei]|uniref:Uncharacterized protein n=1 Tax=Thelohanellus kitauei TaxID=669202 RepID=A0A0C2MZJ4_THEKT|nr:hypothetical protein RF11_00425 [Thelohanellus kitauei]
MVSSLCSVFRRGLGWFSNDYQLLNEETAVSDSRSIDEILDSDLLFSEQSNEPFWTFIEKGRRYEKSGRYKQAGETYVYSAAYCYRESSAIAAIYQHAIECFLRVKDSQADIALTYASGIFVMNSVPEKAIELCFIYGHKFNRAFSHESRDSCYQKGDSLRHRYNLHHACVMAIFDESQYNGDLTKANADYSKVN